MIPSNHFFENRNSIFQPLHFALNPTSFLPQLLQRSIKVSHSLPSPKNLTHNVPDKYTRKIGLTYLKVISNRDKENSPQDSLLANFEKSIHRTIRPAYKYP